MKVVLNTVSFLVLFLIIIVSSLFSTKYESFYNMDSFERLKKKYYTAYNRDLYTYTNDLIGDYIGKNENMGAWEENLCQIMASYYIDGTDFLDIGANIGLSSIRTHNIKQITGTIHMFECQPDVFSMLQFNTDHLPRKLYNVALSDKDNIVEIKQDHANIGGTKVALIGANRATNSIIQVTTTLDKFEFPNKISVIKIDIEGHEFECLKGGIETIKKHHPTIIIEIWDNTPSSKETIKFIEYLGYKLAVKDGVDHVYVYNN